MVISQQNQTPPKIETEAERLARVQQEDQEAVQATLDRWESGRSYREARAEMLKHEPERNFI